MNLEKIINSSFESRMHWDLKDLEIAEEIISQSQDENIKLVMELEKEQELNYGELLDYYHLETNVWREVKAEYPDVEIPSLNIEYVDTLSEEDKSEYLRLREYARKNFKSKSIEMKIRLYKETKRIHNEYIVSD